MKVTIESELITTDNLSIAEFNYIVSKAIKAKSINEFKSIVFLKLKTLVYGFGSNHIWVKQFNPNGDLSNNRLLFIQ